MEEVKIKTEYIKLDQFLKFSGVADTGGEGKFLIRDEKVKVNGKVVTQRGRKLVKGDIVEILGSGSYIVI